jgi:hypothetical protein
MNDTRNTITNLKRKIGVLPRPNPYDFSRVICSADCSNIYAKEVDDVGLRNVCKVGLLHMNLRSVEGGKEERERVSGQTKFHSVSMTTHERFQSVGLIAMVLT